MNVQSISAFEQAARPENVSREERLRQVLGVAIMRESTHAWDNALAQLGPVTVEQVNAWGLPTICAQYDSLDILAALKVMGADLTKASYDGKSPIHVAAENGFSDIVSFLLDSGVDPNIRVSDPKDALGMNGRTPLHMAAFEAEADVCAILLSRGADVNALCDQGHTPLHQAMEGVTDDRLTEMLLRAGASDQDIVRVWQEHYPDSTLANAFQIVVRQGLVGTAGYYMGERLEDPNQLTRRGKTMLQLAKMAGSKAEEMRNMILSHRCCADVMSRVSCAGGARPSVSM